MSYIVASLPPLKCFVRREFLYNHTKGHGELEPAIWVSIKAPVSYTHLTLPTKRIV